MTTNTASTPRTSTPEFGLFADLEQSLVPKRAVSYIRVSTREQAERGGREEGFSIPAQREANKRKAQSLGAMVVKEFADRGETGTTTNRRGLKDMLAYLTETPEIDYVIVHKLDRLARSRAGDVDITRALDTAGVRLISTTENIDQTPGGMLMHGIMSSIAEFYSRNLATEVVKGMTEKAQSGGTPGRAPLGYVNHRGIDERGREYRTVDIDPERAPLMRRAFELYATGRWTLNSLADHLNADGLTTRPTPQRPSIPITDKALNRLLTLPYYRGIVIYQGVEYPGTHEPLVTPETWLKVQSVLSAHRSGERTRKHPHFLKTTLMCRRCGSRMLVHRAKSKNGDIYPYFVCCGRKARTAICDLKAVLIDIVEDKVASLYRTIALTPEDCEQIEAFILEEIAATSRDTLERRKTLGGEKDRLLRERQRLLQAHYADAIPLELLKNEQNRITNTLTGIDREISALAADETTAKLNLHQILNMLENCHQTYQRLPEHLKRLLNLAFFEHILVDIDEEQQIVVTAKLAEPLATLTRQFRTVTEQVSHKTTENKTSPVLPDETRSDSCAVTPVKTIDHVKGLHTGYMVDLSAADADKWETLLRHGTSGVIPLSPPLATPPAVVDGERVEAIRQRQKRLTQDEIGQVVESYIAGATVYQLAEEFSCHRTTISNHLKANDVTMRLSSPNMEQSDEIFRDYVTGQSMEKIGNRLGFDSTTVLRELRRRGVQTRDTHGRELRE